VNDEADAPANKHKHKIARVEDFIDIVDVVRESRYCCGNGYTR